MHFFQTIVSQQERDFLSGIVVIFSIVVPDYIAWRNVNTLLAMWFGDLCQMVFTTTTLKRFRPFLELGGSSIAVGISSQRRFSVSNPSSTWSFRWLTSPFA